MIGYLTAFIVGGLCLLPFLLRSIANSNKERLRSRNLAIQLATAQSSLGKALNPPSLRNRDWARFIDRYEFPTAMLDRALARCPKATKRADLDMGLRQFFHACGSSASLAAAMPSKTVDEAWHEFMTYTRDYAAFCDEVFGQMLHHVPETTMSKTELDTNHSTGMVVAWSAACAHEIVALFGPKAPILFAADERGYTRRSGQPKPLHYVGCCTSDPSTALDTACTAPTGTVCMLHTYTNEWSRLRLLPARAPIADAATISTTKTTTKHADTTSAGSYDDGGAAVAATLINTPSCGASPSSCSSSSCSSSSSSSSCGSSSSSSSCGSSCGGGGD